MPKKFIFLLSFPLSLNAISLGRLVDNPKAPSQGFFDPSEKLLSKPKPTLDISLANNISRLLASGNKGNFELTLAAFASTFFKGEHKDVRQLTAKQVKQCSLLNSTEWFDEICAARETRVWLERAAMRGRKTYLVTGLQTLTDASINDDHKRHFGTGAGLQAPLLAAAGVPVPTPLDPSVTIGSSVSRDAKIKYEIPDEKIYSIQYREVRLRKGDAKEVLGAKLSSKTWWEQICADRLAVDLDGDDDEVIAAEVTDVGEVPPGLEEAGDEGEDTYFLEASSEA